MPVRILTQNYHSLYTQSKTEWKRLKFTPKQQRLSCMAVIVIFAIILVATIAGYAVDGADFSDTSGDTTSTQTMPTSMPTLQQSIQQEAQSSLTVDGTITRVDIFEGAVTIDDTVEEQWDNGSYVSTGRRSIVEIEQAVWQANPHLSSITVQMYGPPVDTYGNSSSDVFMWATLSNSTEKLFNWNYLVNDPDQAWTDYDTKWALSSLDN